MKITLHIPSALAVKINQERDYKSVQTYIIDKLNDVLLHTSEQQEIDKDKIAVRTE